MIRKVLTGAILGYLSMVSVPGEAQLNPREMASFCDSLMQYGVNYPMMPGGVISLVSSDSVYLMKGYGFGNLERGDPVEVQTTLFQLGSVGKVFTAIAALHQVERGQLQLEADVNTYLRNWQIENPFDTTITLKSLLTHTAGLDDRVIGYMVRSEKDIQPLGEHLMKNMPALFQEPGRSINYSNYGYALAGYLVEIASGSSFTNYVQREIIAKTGMENTTYYLPDNYETYASDTGKHSVSYSAGYQWRDTFNIMKVYPRHAVPAGSVLSTGADMALFIQALLRKDNILLGKNTYRYLLEQQFTNHPLLTGYTLGMEVQNINGYPAVGKGGNVPGFLSMLLLFPGDNLGLFIALNTQTDNFLELFFEGLKQRFFKNPDQEKTSYLEVDVDPYTGVYLNERANHHTIEEMFALFDGQFSFWKSKAGNLACFHNGKTQEYAAVQEDVFQNIADRGQHIIFTRNARGRIESMYRNYRLGCIQVPASYRKAGWFERPRFLNDEYPYLLLILTFYLALPLIWFAVYFIRKKRPAFLKKTKIPYYYHAAAFLFLGLFFWNIIGFWLPLLKDRQAIFFEFDQTLYSMRYFNYAMAANAIALILLSVWQWICRHGNFWIRLYYLLFALTGLCHILILHRWHFLSITYH